jgi:hypothetical protein
VVVLGVHGPAHQVRHERRQRDERRTWTWCTWPSRACCRPQCRGSSSAACVSIRSKPTHTADTHLRHDAKVRSVLAAVSDSVRDSCQRAHTLPATR